jgi:centrosomal protein CEP104
LKQVIAELYRIGEKLARYDLEKRQAIEDEDYEKAKIKTEQMKIYRAETHKGLRDNNLIDLLDVIIFSIIIILSIFF